MADTSFAQFIVEQLWKIECVRYRRMFGGFGLYGDDVFFGIISEDRLYFKTDENTRTRYLESGSDCFRPSKKQVLKNYYEVPVDVIENPEVLEEWAREAMKAVN